MRDLASSTPQKKVTNLFSAILPHSMPFTIAQTRAGLSSSRTEAEAGLDISHEQDRGNALAGDIRNADSQPVALKPEHIEVVSADRARGAPCVGYSDSRKLWNLLGQKRLLDFAGALQFLFVDFQAGCARPDHALQFDIAALEPSLCLAVEKIHYAVDEGDQEWHLPASGEQVPERLRTRRGQPPDNEAAQRVNGKHQDAQHSQKDQPVID